MNRNTNSHFANVPLIDIPRSAFPMVQNIRTTFNMGEIIPFYIDLDGLPGDSFKYNFTLVIRQSTPLNPTMDNSYADIYWFKVPWRILWKHMKEFVGENTNGAWYQSTEYTIPMFKTPSGGLQKGCIAEKMGIPQNVPNLEFSQLGVRAYVMIYNYFFRDQNLIAPETEYTDDTARTASNSTTTLGGAPYKAAKFHDYFTSCLPGPQKGPAVTLPVGSSSAPLTGYGKAYGTGKALGLNYQESVSPYATKDGGLFSGDSGTWGKLAVAENFAGAGIGPAQTPSGAKANDNTGVGLNTDPDKSQVRVDLSGVLADLSSAFSATINAQRYAYALQKMYEKDSRYGSTFKQVIRGHFHTTLPDARYQIPEYLGGKRIPITLNQVLQTSAQQSGGTPLGDTGAFSLTADSSEMFSTSLVEWSVIVGLIVVRQDHSYCQGLNRQWSRKRKFDLFWPGFDHLGEMPVYNKEIFAQGDQVLNSDNTPVDDDVFGYQEAWASYRYKPSLNTGAFSSNYAQSLDIWHYGDDYATLPVLSQNWIEETKDYLDRTLAVTSAVEDQYLMDSLVTIQARRCMSTYSVPGLVDHY